MKTGKATYARRQSKTRNYSLKPEKSMSVSPGMMITLHGWTFRAQVSLWPHLYEKLCILHCFERYVYHIFDCWEMVHYVIADILSRKPKFCSTLRRADS